jgi:hypothetical protein
MLLFIPVIKRKSYGGFMGPQAQGDSRGWGPMQASMGNKDASLTIRYACAVPRLQCDWELGYGPPPNAAHFISLSASHCSETHFGTPAGLRPRAIDQVRPCLIA